MFCKKGSAKGYGAFNWVNPFVTKAGKSVAAYQAVLIRLGYSRGLVSAGWSKEVDRNKMHARYSPTNMVLIPEETLTV